MRYLEDVQPDEGGSLSDSVISGQRLRRTGLARGSQSWNRRLRLGGARPAPRWSLGGQGVRRRDEQTTRRMVHVHHHGRRRLTVVAPARDPPRAERAADLRGDRHRGECRVRRPRGVASTAARGDGIRAVVGDRDDTERAPSSQRRAVVDDRRPGVRRCRGHHRRALATGTARPGPKVGVRPRREIRRGDRGVDPRRGDRHLRDHRAGRADRGASASTFARRTTGVTTRPRAAGARAGRARRRDGGAGSLLTSPRSE